jgi:hypothetical protein
MSKAATTEELSGIHKHVSNTLVEDLHLTVPKIEDIDDDETRKLKLRLADTVLRLRHDARAHAITFLKNNSITASEGNAEMSALKAALKNRARQPRAGVIPQQALDEAADLYGNSLQ